MKNSHNMWLTPEEAETWFNMWTFYSGIPSRLDALLKRDAGISHYEFIVMQGIQGAVRGRIRMTDLAVNVDISLSHLSRVITRLEGRGLVRRVPDPYDGRSILVELTAMGSDKFMEVSRNHDQELQRLVFSNLTEEEIRQLSQTVAKLAGAVRSQGRLLQT